MGNSSQSPNEQSRAQPQPQSQPQALEDLLSEAQKARAEAEAASQRAAQLVAQADAARRRAAMERAAQRRAWAQRIVDTYEADLDAAEAALQEGRDQFEAAAVKDPAAAIRGYLAWGEAALRHYALQVRVGTVAPELGLEATPPERASPPPFSQALDQAIQRHLAGISAKLRDETADEIRRALDEEDATAGAAAF